MLALLRVGVGRSRNRCAPARPPSFDRQHQGKGSYPRPASRRSHVTAEKTGGQLAKTTANKLTSPLRRATLRKPNATVPPWCHEAHRVGSIATQIIVWGSTLSSLAGQPSGRLFASRRHRECLAELYGDPGDLRQAGQAGPETADTTAAPLCHAWGAPRSPLIVDRNCRQGGGDGRRWLAQGWPARGAPRTTNPLTAPPLPATMLRAVGPPRSQPTTQYRPLRAKGPFGVVNKISKVYGVI